MIGFVSRQILKAGDWKNRWCKWKINWISHFNWCLEIRKWKYSAIMKQKRSPSSLQQKCDTGVLKCIAFWRWKCKKNQSDNKRAH